MLDLNDKFAYTAITLTVVVTSYNYAAEASLALRASKLDNV